MSCASAAVLLLIASVVVTIAAIIAAMIDPIRMLDLIFPFPSRMDVIVDSFALTIKDFFPADAQISLKYEQLYIRRGGRFFRLNVLFCWLGGLVCTAPSIFAFAGPGGSKGYMDPLFKRVLWYLIGSTKGGINRVKIINLINSHPANANQISSESKLDYKTVIHHIRVLSQNGLIITDNKDS